MSDTLSPSHAVRRNVDGRLHLDVLPPVLVAAILALVGLGSLSLWQDEAYTVSLAKQSWGSFVETMVHSEVSSASYNLLMWGWIRLGDGEAFVRLPSAIFSIAAVPVVYLLAGELSRTRRVATVAAWVMALHGGLVIYAQEARTYSLAVLVTAVLLLLFVAGVNRPSRLRYLGWVIAAVVLVCTHLVAAALVLSGLALSIPFIAPLRQRRRQVVVGLIPSVVVGCAVTAATVLSQNDGGIYQDLALRPHPKAALLALTGYTGVLGVVAFLLIGGAAIVALRGERATREWQRVVPLVWVAAPIALAVILSVGIPIGGRYVLPLVPALAVVVGQLVGSIAGTAQRMAALAVVLALLGLGALDWHLNGVKQDWRALVPHVISEAQPGDRFMFDRDETRIPFDLYLARTGPFPQDLIAYFPDAAWGTFQTGDQKYESLTGDTTESVAAGGRVWLIADDTVSNADDLESARAGLRVAHNLETRLDFEGNVSAELYVVA